MAFISICIPAYKHAEFLNRLLHSITIQTFKDFEVIVTDDSPDNEVALLCNKYKSSFNLVYHKNEVPLGTPANWNKAIQYAKGDWIKIMHHDDWFANEFSLKKFYNATLKNANCSFFFSAFQNITYSTGEKQIVTCNFFDRLMLRRSLLHLFKRVYIGNPSCTLVLKDREILYDKKFKWVVDFEYYIRYITKHKRWKYIPDILLNIGFHDDQVTKYTLRNPAVEIPESQVMLEKLGFKILRNIIVYDYYWRLYRNFNIKDVNEISKYYLKSLHPILTEVINFQKKIPAQMLKIGIISKFLMSVMFTVSLFKKI